MRVSSAISDSGVSHRAHKEWWTASYESAVARGAIVCDEAFGM